jgi:hypothetical protein
MNQTTADYVETTDAVLRAGRRLQKILATDKSKVNFAVSQLEQAAQSQDSRGASYRAFMFSQLEGAPAEAKNTRERVTEDLFASVLADVQTANVLLTSGQNLGETGSVPNPQLLDEALSSLENTKRSLESSVVGPLAADLRAGRFGFADDLGGAKPVPAADLTSAIKKFTDASNDTLISLVDEAQGVVKYVFEGLSKIDAKKVADALGELGKPIEGLQGIGRLVSQGIEKLKKAMDALTTLLDSKALAAIRERAGQVWKDLREGKLLGQVLGWAFDVDLTRKHIQEIMRVEGLRIDALNKACDDVAQLKIKFQENITIARRIAGGVTLAGTVLAMTTIAAPTAALATASAYVLILAGVVLIGMDYADSGRILDRVRGVDEIASDLRTV